MNDWELIDIDQDGMYIHLSLSDPISVSSLDTPDLLFIQLELGGLQKEKGETKVMKSIVKYIEIPTQMKNQEEVDTIDGFGTNISDSM